jgi:hypothetical protein
MKNGGQPLVLDGPGRVNVARQEAVTSGIMVRSLPWNWFD